MYCAELSPRRMRGALTSFNEMFINVGIPIAYLANLLLQGLKDDWRWMLLSGTLPAGALFIATLFLPESPRWLLKRNRHEEAQKIVRHLISTDEDPALARRVTTQMMHDMKQDMQEDAVRWVDLFKQNRKVLAIGMAFAAIQQLVGCDAILFYSAITFKEHGVSEKLALVFVLVLGLCKLAFTILASMVVDQKSVGRRKPLLIGGVGCMLGTLVVALVAACPASEATAATIVTGVLVFISSFGFSYGPLCWLILAEMFNGPYRSKAMSLGSTINRSCSFVVTLLFLTLTQAITWTGTFMVFTTFGLVGVIFSYYCIPDLAGAKLGGVNAEVCRYNLRIFCLLYFVT
mmetsp:Transcript_4737/g.9435  ORF Transcript_4737/g.9435 Transcript_4737/m.9435 type:complete len:346 (-) Transcript_4737:267-1304(-)